MSPNVAIADGGILQPFSIFSIPFAKILHRQIENHSRRHPYLLSPRVGYPFSSLHFFSQYPSRLLLHPDHTEIDADLPLRLLCFDSLRQGLDNHPGPPCGQGVTQWPNRK